MQLTTHLPTTLSPENATTHPFLSAAGKGLLPAPTLSQWLSQDRLYAQAYVRFIGLLLSKMQLPVTPAAPSPTARAVSILIDAAVNIQRELQFFEDVAREYALDLTAPPSNDTPGADGGAAGRGAFGPSPITHAYIDMFMAAGSPAVSVLEGLVVLWATEVCYLRAWRYAASFLGEKPAGGRDADGGALRERFIPNWSSAVFEQFVDSIGEVVDAMGESVDDEMLAKCERWWKQVVWLEERFWPDVQ